METVKNGQNRNFPSDFKLSIHEKAVHSPTGEYLFKQPQNRGMKVDLENPNLIKVYNKVLKFLNENSEDYITSYKYGAPTLWTKTKDNPDSQHIVKQRLLKEQKYQHIPALWGVWSIKEKNPENLEYYDNGKSCSKNYTDIIMQIRVTAEGSAILSIPVIFKNEKIEIYPSEFLLYGIYTLFSQNKALQQLGHIAVVQFCSVMEISLTNVCQDMYYKQNADNEFFRQAITSFSKEDDDLIDKFPKIFKCPEDNTSMLMDEPDYFHIFQSNVLHHSYYNSKEPNIVNHPFYKLINRVIRVLGNGNIFVVAKNMCDFEYYLSAECVVSTFDSKALYYDSNHDYQAGNIRSQLMFQKMHEFATKLMYKDIKEDVKALNEKITKQMRFLSKPE
jgi:hypothetical protein